MAAKRKVVTKKKVKKNVSTGAAHIQSSFNNTTGVPKAKHGSAQCKR